MPLHATRIARKPHRCGWECGAPINPGESYVRSALPPWTEPNASDRWWSHALHGATPNDCPVYAPWLPRDPIAAELAYQTVAPPLPASSVGRDTYTDAQEG